MDIDGLGDETIELLFANNLLLNVADIYDLTPEQLSALPRLGEKSAANIMQSIEVSKGVEFARVLFALGIRFVGETTAKHLARSFKSLEALSAASREELLLTEEVGDKIADSILGYFADGENQAILSRLRAAGITLESQTEELLSQSLIDKSFVVSGKFTTFDRDELKKLIEQHGGKVLSGVSANVDFLVAGDKMGPAKLQKAEKLGVKIISEQQFAQMIQSDEQVNEQVKQEVQEVQEVQEAQRIENENNNQSGEAAQGSLF